MENNNIELSETEKHLILLNREKVEIEAKQKLAELQLRQEKQITDKKIEIEKFKAKKNQLNLKVKEFYKDFDHELYTLVELPRSNEFKCTNHKPDSKLDEVFFSVDVEYIESFISRNGTNNNIRIEVEEHIVYTSNFRSKNAGLKMRISGIDNNRFLISVKTVMTNIEEYINVRKRKQSHEENAKTSFNMALSELTEKYPNAVIKTSEYDKKIYLDFENKSRVTVTVGYNILDNVLKPTIYFSSLYLHEIPVDTIIEMVSKL